MIHRFRSFEEAQRALWQFETDAEYYRMLASLFHLGWRLASSTRPAAGVFRFHSIEDANIDRTSKHSCQSFIKVNSPAISEVKYSEQQ